MNYWLPQAVLLDLDDTILDDTGSVHRCWRDACVTHRALLEAIDPDVLHETILRLGAWYWSDPDRHRTGRLDLMSARSTIVQMALADSGKDLPEVAARIAESYGAARDQAIRPFEEAIETVGWLRTSGCRLGLLTNGAGPAQRVKIDRYALAGLFDVVLIEGELGYGKPDPRVYERALTELRVSPRCTWMVGDNLEWDIMTPQQLGIFGIRVDRPGRGLPPTSAVRPNRVIQRLSELRTPAVGVIPA